MRLGLGSTTIVVLLLLAGCSGGGAEENEARPTEQVLRWGMVLHGSEPRNAWDALSKLPINVPWNVFDPLVKVDEDLEAVPNVAERWDWSDGGRTITFHLRRDGRWTNGDPLTAHDFVFGWRYMLAKDRPSPAGVFSFVAGGDPYSECDPDKRDCEALWEDVGVRALDDWTLEVRLTEPQPWFPALLGGFSCVCFTALHRPTVERLGADWAEPENVVTSGPFKVARRSPGKSLVLVKNESWRGADEIALDRIEIRFFHRDADAVRALEAGEIDVTEAEGGSVADEAVYPWLKTQFVGIVVADVPDPRQRRAMALALDRTAIARKVPVGEARPATSMTADGVPGFGRIASAYLRPDAQLEEARRLLAAVEKPRRTIELWAYAAPGWRAEATEIAAAWRRIGIATTFRPVPDWGEYIKLFETARFEDTFLTNFVYDAPYPANLFAEQRCGARYYPTGYCDAAFDRLLDRAAAEPDEEARLELYAQAEAILTGPDGAMPTIPLWWGSRSTLERPTVRKTFELNKAGQVDLTRVRIAPE